MKRAQTEVGNSAWLEGYVLPYHIDDVDVGFDLFGVLDH